MNNPHDSVVRYLRHKRNDRNAEDHAQDAAVRMLMRKKGSLDPCNPVNTGFACETADNSFKNECRNRRKEVCFADHFDPSCKRKDPCEEAITNEVMERLRSAIAKLPAWDREIIRLAYFDGLTNNAVSELLLIPLGTVKTHLYRIRAELARMLAE